MPCINGFLSEVRIFFLFSQLVKLVNKRLRLTLNTIYDLLSLTSCLFKLGFFLIVEFFFLLCKLFSESLAFRTVFLRKPVVFFKLYSCAFKIVYDSFKLSVVLRNKRLSVLDYILVDTKAFRDSKALDLPGEPMISLYVGCKVCTSNSHEAFSTSGVSIAYILSS